MSPACGTPRNGPAALRDGAGAASRSTQLGAPHAGKQLSAAAAPCPDRRTRSAGVRVHRLTLDEKYALCRSVAEECIQEDELRRLLEKKPNPVAYDGFEPSGRMHIAQGVLKALNVNKLTKSGVTFKFWWVTLFITDCMKQLHGSRQHWYRRRALPATVHDQQDQLSRCPCGCPRRRCCRDCTVQGGGLVRAPEQQDGGGPEEDPDGGEVSGGDLEGGGDEHGACGVPVRLG